MNLILYPLLACTISVHASQRTVGIHPDVGAITRPLEPIYIAATTWNHGFRVDMPCISSVITRNRWDSFTMELDTVVSAALAYNKSCTSEYGFGTDEKSYICDLVQSANDLLVSELHSLTYNLIEGRKVTQTFRDMFPEYKCRDVPDIHDGKSSLTIAMGESESESIGRRKRSPYADDTHVTRNDHHLVAGVSPIDHVNVETNTEPPHLPHDARPMSIHIGSHGTYITDVRLGNNAIFRPDDKPLRRDDQDQDMSAHDDNNIQIDHTTKSPIKQSSHRRSMKYADLSTKNAIAEVVLGRLATTARNECFSKWHTPSFTDIMSSYKLAINAYLKATGVSLCDLSIPDLKCDSEGVDHEGLRYRRSVDADPGWIPWNFSVSKWMWGGLGSQDADAINKQFNLSLTATEESHKEFLIFAADTTSALQVVDKNIKSQSLELSRSLNDLRNQTVTWASQMSQTLRNITDGTTASYLSSTANLLMIRLMQANGRVTQMRNLVVSVISRMNQIVTSVQLQEFPRLLISREDIDQAVSMIRSSVPSDLQLIPLLHSSALFVQLPPSCVANPHYIMFHFKLPLVASPYNYEAWELMTLAMNVGHSYVRLQSHLKGILFDSVRQSWYGLGQSELSLCSNNLMRVCPFVPPLHMATDKSC